MKRLAALLAVTGCVTLSTWAAAQSVHVTLTTSDLHQALTPQKSIRFHAASPAAQSLLLDVNAKQQFQEFDGVGASLTDSAAYLLETNLDAATRGRAMRALFDRKQGIGLGILRQPMGGTDLSRTHYTYDDMPLGQKDPKLEHFSIARDEAVILPALTEALKINPEIKVMGTPWSAPGWMKSNESMIKGKVLPEAYPALAEYFVKYIQAYRAKGVKLWAVTLQNEPLFEPEDYMGELMVATDQSAILGGYVGPAFEKAGITTKVMVYDHNWDHSEYPATVLGDEKAARYAAGTAYHCYGGKLEEAHEQTHAQFPGKDIWETECSGGLWQEHPFAEASELLIEAPRHWARSVVLWGLALDPKGNPHAGGCDKCRGVITVDGREWKPTQDYYILGQAGHFVAPGAHRIASSELKPKGVLNVAFQNPDGSIVLLLFNGKAESVALAIQQDGRVADYTLAGNTLATLVWTPRHHGNER